MQDLMQESILGSFDTHVLNLHLPSTDTHVLIQWRRKQDTRTDNQKRYDGFWLIQYWELEEATRLSKGTIRNSLDRLVKCGILEKRAIRADGPFKGELWLRKVDETNLKQAQLNVELAQEKVRPIPVCKKCGKPHVKDTVTRFCSDCDEGYVLYETDHGAAYDYFIDLCSVATLRRENGYVTIAQFMKVNKMWFLKEERQIKKPLKSEHIKRLFAGIGIEYRVSHNFKRYVGICLSAYGQQLLEGQAS